MKIFDLTNYLTIKGTNPPPCFRGWKRKILQRNNYSCGLSWYQCVSIKCFRKSVFLFFARKVNDFLANTQKKSQKITFFVKKR